MERNGAEREVARKRRFSPAREKPRLERAARNPDEGAPGDEVEKGRGGLP